MKIIFIILFLIFVLEIFKNKPYLWLYWDGPKSSIIELCHQSILKHCSKSFNIIFLNKYNILNYLPELSNFDLDKLIIAHKVDIYRIMLLYKYGGLYLDSDIVVLKDLSEIITKLNYYDFVGFGCTGFKCNYGYGYPSNWALASRPNTQLMKNILNNQLNKLNTQNKFDYHDLGKKIIWNELKNYHYYHYPNSIDGTRDKYGNWINNNIIFSNQKIDYDDENKMLFLVLYNSELEPNLKNKSIQELLNTNTNFSRFILKSLKE